MCHDAGAPATTVLNNRQALKSQVAPTDGGVIPIKAHLKSSQMGGAALFTPETHFHTCEAPLGRLVCAARARSPSCIVRRCDRRAHRTAFAHGIDRVSSGAFLHGAPRALLHLRREHMRLPLSPSKLWVCPRAYFHSRAPPPTRSATLLSTPARFTARDCPILRPRAGLPLSRQAKRPLELAAARDPIFPC